MKCYSDPVCSNIIISSGAKRADKAAKGHIKHADLVVKLIFDFAKTYATKYHDCTERCKFNNWNLSISCHLSTNQPTHKLTLSCNKYCPKRSSAAQVSGKLFKYSRTNANQRLVHLLPVHKYAGIIILIFPNRMLITKFDVQISENDACMRRYSGSIKPITQNANKANNKANRFDFRATRVFL